MIRNVIVHIANEQPMLADLYDVPQASDAGLLCTNLRAKDGKRPVFIDTVDNTFFFPYRAIRFLEIPAGALQRHRADGGRAAPGDQSPQLDPPSGPVDSTLPAVIEVGAGSLDLDDDDEIDEEFLRRIRDV